MRVKRALILGGAGFIGANTALHFLKKGWRVTIADNFSRMTSKKNALWLRLQGSFEFVTADIRQARRVEKIIEKGRFDVIVHLAGQVAVTKSVIDPRSDFEINAVGTLNVLEAIRRKSPKSFLILSSTNKVYGGLEFLRVANGSSRYILQEMKRGVSENTLLDFHSPYGCSKGAADQYTLDYARIYGLQSVVFRQSCIYGPLQYGMEDQGWLAWFIIAALQKKQITLYGSGRQVRDVLYIDDLMRLYLAAYQQREKCVGQAFNVGGGAKNTFSLLELIDTLNDRHGFSIIPRYQPPRPGDQKIYISDIAKAKKILGWQPRVDKYEGLQRLVSWLRHNQP